MAGARGSRRQVSWAARDNRGTVRAGIFTLCGPYNGWEAGLGGEKERSDKFARGAQADWAMILLISFRAALAAGASTRPQEPGRERGRKKWSSTSRTTLETTGDTREGAWAAGARRGSRFSRFEGAVSTGALAGPPTVQVNLRWALPGLGSARAPGRPRVAPARPPPTPGGRPCVGSGAGGGPSTSPASSATRGTAGTVPEESARYPRTGAGASQRAREQCRYTRRGDELQKQSHHRPRLSAWQVPQVSHSAACPCVIATAPNSIPRQINPSAHVTSVGTLAHDQRRGWRRNWRERESQVTGRVKNILRCERGRRASRLETREGERGSPPIGRTPAWSMVYALLGCNVQGRTMPWG